MEDKHRPSTTVRINGDYRGTYVLKRTAVRSHEITAEGDHVLVLEATARGGARPPRRESKKPA